MRIIKHLYQRTVVRKGRKIKVWYFWYYDNRKRQVRKTCGTNNKPCLLKRDAERFLAKLDDEVLGYDEVNRYLSYIHDEMIALFGDFKMHKLRKDYE